MCVRLRNDLEQRRHHFCLGSDVAQAHSRRRSTIDWSQSYLCGAPLHGAEGACALVLLHKCLCKPYATYEYACQT